MLFDSSIRKELARSFGATLVVLITVVMTMMLIRVLGQASRGSVAPSDVMLVMGFTVLGQLSTILSLSLFITVVGTLSRMYRDSEMVIWFSAGRGLMSLLGPLLRFSWPIMLTIAAVTVLLARSAPSDILTASTFKSGMSAAICVLGVAWLGTTFVQAYTDDIKGVAGQLLADYPWMLAVVLFFAAALLYSQAATTKALMPTALALGVAPLAAVAAFPAVSALFVLPTYPTLLAAVEMDDTGSTRIGKAVFNHAFLVPGILTISFAVILGFLFGSLVI